MVDNETDESIDKRKQLLVQASLQPPDIIMVNMLLGAGDPFDPETILDMLLGPVPSAAA